MEALVSYTGEIDEIVYYNNENGYCIFDLRLENEQLLTCTGTVYQAYLGEMIEVTGKFVNHKIYGKQFQVEHYLKKEIKKASSIVKYLSSGIFKGVGEKTAQKIVDEFGEDTFEVIENEYEKLAEIKGITLEKARQIQEEFIIRSQMRNFIMSVQKYDMSISIATKIYEKYKEKSMHIIENNPYLLIEEIEDITFKLADRIAQKSNISLDNKTRIEEGIRYTLKMASLSGHVYLPKNELITNSKHLLELWKDEKIEDCIESLIRERKIFSIKDDETIEKIYLKKFYYAEKNVADKLADMLENDEYYILKELDFKTKKKKIENKQKQIVKKEKEINGILKELNLNLSDEQYEAVLNSLMNDVTIITGGPGTGKTTIIKVIVKYYELNQKKVSLVAPTGRAAKRMSESTLMEAKTIHRLLEVQPVSIENERQQFARNEENPLEADVIIIDEMSMVDIQLFNSFLNAVELGTKLIIVGDDKQLPSVGAGNVLKDLIESNTIKTSFLNQVFRQAEQSMIIKNAHLIRNSKNPDLITKNDDFFFINANNEQKALELIKELAHERLPKFLNCKSDEIQILAPMKKGSLGTQNLNVELQNVINPKLSFLKKESEIKYGNKAFRIGDKIMQIKNNYEIEWERMSSLGIKSEKGKGVFNGDVGKIIDIDLEKDEIVVKFDDEKEVTYETNMIKELDHAYAITVHKSQGSEYKAVIIPVFDVPELLMNRNLIYTGITRAKTLIVLIGLKDVVYRMVGNDTDEKRYSNLKNQLNYRIPSGEYDE